MHYCEINVLLNDIRNLPERWTGMDDYLIDIQDVARQLKIPPKTIRNKLSNGSWPLKPIRIGRALRWRQVDVDTLKRGNVPTSCVDNPN